LKLLRLIAERITWPGMLRGELKWGASHQENFGIVVPEELACGLPVAIAEPVNISAEVRVARASLVHADTAAGTTEALRRWLALPAQDREQMGLRAAELFNEQFDFASMAKNLMPLLTGYAKQLTRRKSTDATALAIHHPSKLSQCAMLTPRGFRILDLI
jgi:hypothetical protein